MRAYFFGNMYLSSIQQGIQAAHVTHELFLKYDNIAAGSFATTELYDWAKLHKTMILLNGGYSENLRELIAMFDTRENPYPWAHFNEGEDSLDGALTCVGIILPEKIYVTADALRKGNIGAEQLPIRGCWSPEDDVSWEISKWEYNLCKELNKYGLAS